MIQTRSRGQAGRVALGLLGQHRVVRAVPPRGRLRARPATRRRRPGPGRRRRAAQPLASAAARRATRISAGPGGQGGGEAGVVVGSRRLRGRGDRPFARSSSRPACRHPRRLPRPDPPRRDRPAGVWAAGAKLSSAHGVHLPGPAAHARAPMTVDLPLADRRAAGRDGGGADRHGRRRPDDPDARVRLRRRPADGDLERHRGEPADEARRGGRPPPARDGEPAGWSTWLCVGSVPAAFSGAWLISQVPAEQVDIELLLKRGAGRSRCLSATFGLLVRALDRRCGATALPLGEGAGRCVARRPAVVPRPVLTVDAGGGRRAHGRPDVGRGGIDRGGRAADDAPGASRPPRWSARTWSQAIPLVGPRRRGHLLFGGFSMAVAHVADPGRDPGRLDRRPDLHPCAGRHDPAHPRGAAARVLDEAAGRSTTSSCSAAAAAAFVLGSMAWIASGGARADRGRAGWQPRDRWRLETRCRPIPRRPRTSHRRARPAAAADRRCRRPPDDDPDRGARRRRPGRPGAGPGRRDPRATNSRGRALGAEEDLVLTDAENTPLARLPASRFLAPAGGPAALRPARWPALGPRDADHTRRLA